MEPLRITILVTVLARDPMLRAGRDYSGLSMTLKQAQKETSQREGAEEEEDQLWLSHNGETEASGAHCSFSDSRP